jgi:stage II sporulation protein Q
MKPDDPNQVPSFEKAKRRLKWKRLFAKKWFFPAIYISAAALVLSIAWWYQGNKLQQVTRTMETEDIIPSDTKNLADDMVLPVAEDSQAEKKMGFYEEAGSNQNKEASLVKYANTYWPHAGIDFARKDGKEFEIVAVLDGKVTRVEENPLVGYQIEIEHETGLVTVYQSLDDIKVQKGQTVKQGDVLAKTGRNTFEKESGNHLHFEIRKNNEAINPDQYLK